MTWEYAVLAEALLGIMASFTVLIVLGLVGCEICELWQRRKNK